MQFKARYLFDEKALGINIKKKIIQNKQSKIEIRQSKILIRPQSRYLRLTSGIPYFAFKIDSKASLSQTLPFLTTLLIDKV